MTCPWHDGERAQSVSRTHTVTSEQVEVIGSWGLLWATRDPKGRGSQQQGKAAPAPFGGPWGEHRGAGECPPPPARASQAWSGSTGEAGVLVCHYQDGIRLEHSNALFPEASGWRSKCKHGCNFTLITSLLCGGERHLGAPWGTLRVCAAHSH